MKKQYLAIFALLMLGIVFSGYQCASTELTSAKLYIQQKNWDKALSALEKEVEKNPKSAEGYYYMGVVYAEKDQLDKMVESFDKSLEAGPKFQNEIESYKLAEWADSFNKGVALYNRAASTQAEDSLKMFMDMAIGKFENAAMLAPDSTNSYANLVMIYLSQNEFEKAVEPLEKLIELEQDADSYYRLGFIIKTEGDELMKKFAESGNNADSVAAREKYDEAITLLEEGRSIHQNNSEIIGTLVDAYSAAGMLDEGIDAFKALAENNPDNESFIYNYGVLLLRMERFEDAVEQFEKAIQINPEYTDAKYNLGATYFNWALNLKKEAEEKEEESVDADKKFELAVKNLEAYSAEKPGDPKGWNALAKAYANLGMSEEANKAFEKFDELIQE